MRTRVRFERDDGTGAVGDLGTRTPNWVLHGEVMAAIKSGTGTEATETVGAGGSQERAGQAWTLTSHWLSGVTPEMQVVWGGKAREIVSAVDPDATGNLLVVTALERTV